MMAQPLQTKNWDLQYLTTNGVWGFFHEIGHNIVKRRFVPRGAVEVVNNLIPQMVNSKVMNIVNQFPRNVYINDSPFRFSRKVMHKHSMSM